MERVKRRKRYTNLLGLSIGSTMADEKSHSLDVFGVKPIADSISHITKATLDGASSFLSRICLPAAEEFGLLLQDKVRVWRAANALKVVAIAQERLPKSKDDFHAHPRLVATMLEHGSWSDDQALQEMWGGLLASSCTQDGRDDSNIIFANLLSHLTSLQVRVLTYSCETCKKVVSPLGLITPADYLIIDLETLKSVTMSDDLHRIDRELDNLRGLELIQHGIDLRSNTVEIAPTSLALNLYARCHGCNGSPVEFFGLSASA